MAEFEINDRSVRELLDRLGCEFKYELVNRLGNTVQVWSNKSGTPEVTQIKGTDRTQLTWPEPDKSTASAEFLHNSDVSGNTHLVLVEFPPGYNKACRVVRRSPAAAAMCVTAPPIVRTDTSPGRNERRDIGGATPATVFGGRRRISA